MSNWVWPSPSNASLGIPSAAQYCPAGPGHMPSTREPRRRNAPRLFFIFRVTLYGMGCCATDIVSQYLARLLMKPLLTHEEASAFLRDPAGLAVSDAKGSGGIAACSAVQCFSLISALPISQNFCSPACCVVLVRSRLRWGVRGLKAATPKNNGGSSVEQRARPTWAAGFGIEGHSTAQHTAKGRSTGSAVHKPLV